MNEEIFIICRVKCYGGCCEPLILGVFSNEEPAIILFEALEEAKGDDYDIKFRKVQLNRITDEIKDCYIAHDDILNKAIELINEKVLKLYIQNNPPDDTKILNRYKLALRSAVTRIHNAVPTGTDFEKRLVDEDVELYLAQAEDEQEREKNAIKFASMSDEEKSKLRYKP